MKETALVHMEVPEEARLISTSSSKENLTLNTVDMKTSTFLTWISVNYVGAGTSVAAGIASDVIAGPALDAFLVPTSITAGIVTGISMVIHGFVTALEADVRNGIKREITSKAKPIAANEWKEALENQKTRSYYSDSAPSGKIRIRNRSVKMPVLAAFMPWRMFRKTLISETVWYEPHKDNFIRESHYMSFRHCTKTVEEFSGRRKTFRTALESI
jgi:hypothetical protein